MDLALRAIRDRARIAGFIVGVSYFGCRESSDVALVRCVASIGRKTMSGVLAQFNNCISRPLVVVIGHFDEVFVVAEKWKVRILK